MFSDTNAGEDPPKTPGPRAGEINPGTLAARAPIALSDEQRRHARFLRFEKKWDWVVLADAFGCSVQEIQHALATIRTPSTSPKRATLNVSLAAYARIQELRQPGEAVWETVNRVLGIE
jgi:hypothetical protein